MNEYCYDFDRDYVNLSIIDRFKYIVRKYSDKIAIDTGNDKISYGDLDKRSDAVANEILENYNDKYALTQKEVVRYKRQIILNGWGIESQEELKSKVAFVAGAGGSASPVIYQLALCGIGTIKVCDYDVVELSNLNRQFLHDESRIGMNKAKSAKITVEKINPNIQVEAIEEAINADNAYDLVGQSDIVFDNVDEINTKFILSDVCISKNIPHVISSMIEYSSYATILYPPKTPCFRCIYNWQIVQDIEECKKIRKEKLNLAVSAPALFVCTGFICNEAIKYLTGNKKIKLNKFFYFNQNQDNIAKESKSYKSIVSTFSNHFKELSKKQGLDWEEGYCPNTVVELTLERNKDCTFCSCISEKTEERDNRFKQTDMRLQSVALLFEQGIDMVIGIIGTIKSGKAYVPLDIRNPLDRLRAILNDCGSRVILTNKKNEMVARQLREITNKNISVILLDSVDYELQLNVQLNIKASSIAYILYTSGTTGKPKGVVQNHKNLLHFIQTYTKSLNISACDKLSLFSSYSFDASIMDIFGAILNGASLYPYNIFDEYKYKCFEEYLAYSRISIYHSTPTLYRILISEVRKKELLATISTLVLGGEEVSKKDYEIYKKHFGEECLFINGLGPSESTVTLQYKADKRANIYDKVPIGIPVQYTKVKIVDEEEKEVMPGNVGEIIYSSDYLALGYLHMPEETNASFKIDADTNARYYKSGDLARMLQNGDLVFAGRKDSQVKIKGYRIELSEIEYAVQEIEGIDMISAIYSARENEIVLFYTTEDNHTIEDNYFKQKIGSKLPDYMIPAKYIHVTKMPLTTTGKLDKNRLLDMLNTPKDSGLIGDGNELSATQVKLLAIWRDAFNRQDIDISDKFMDLGGDSLILLKIRLLITKCFGEELSLLNVFENDTIGLQAKLLDKSACYQDDAL